MWKKLIGKFFIEKLPDRLTSTKVYGAALAWASIKMGIPEEMLSEPLHHIFAAVAQAIPVLWWMFTQGKVDAANKVKALLED